MRKLTILLLLFSFALLVALPNVSHLERVYDVHLMRGVLFEHFFTDYEDDQKYGLKPNIFDESSLFLLTPFIDWNDSDSYRISNSKKLYLAALQNVYVSPTHLGTIFSDNQQLLFNFTYDPTMAMYWPVDDRVHQYNIIHRSKLATVQGPTLFYHTVIDRLPSVLLLKETVLRDSSVKLLINSNGPVPNYLFEYLSLMGIERSQLEMPIARTIYQVDELYFSTPFFMEPIPKKLLMRFRDVVIKASESRSNYKKSNSNLVIIIQRRENDRRISNISELISLINSYFKDKKYEILMFDASMPVADQIQIFNDAKLVIGVMASGQSNIIYSNPRTHVIDIRPDWLLPNGLSWNHGREWCWWLSVAADLNYWPVFEKFDLLDKTVLCPLEKISMILAKICSSL